MRDLEATLFMSYNNSFATLLIFWREREAALYFALIDKEILGFYGKIIDFYFNLPDSLRRSLTSLVN